MRTPILLILTLALAVSGQVGDKDKALGKGMRLAGVQQDANPGQPNETLAVAATGESLAPAATIAVDCSQQQGSFPHYNKFASHIRCAGAASTALMKDVCQRGLIRTFYALDDAVVNRRQSAAKMSPRLRTFQPRLH
jgi:hypothetical protein